MTKRDTRTRAIIISGQTLHRRLTEKRQEIDRISPELIANRHLRAAHALLGRMYTRIDRMIHRIEQVGRMRAAAQAPRLAETIQIVWEEYGSEIVPKTTEGDDLPVLERVELEDGTEAIIWPADELSHRYVKDGYRCWEWWPDLSSAAKAMALLAAKARLPPLSTLGKMGGRGHRVSDGDQAGSTPAADMLADTGRALYGDHWRMPLSRGLEVDDDTIRRWMSGRTKLPPDHGVFSIAAALLRRREREISRAREKLEAWMGDR